jgi:hypothetical protein
MSPHPYRSLPDQAFWRRSVADPLPGDVDPVVNAPFVITPDLRIATAGSCFAQHIARCLRQSGYRFLVTEQAHPIVPAALAEEYGYGLYTARYGNLYTSRQLVQLFQRAYGQFQPDCDFWTTKDGKIVDPFRPQIQPGGFETVAELEADRAHHLACVREAFETVDVFVFTLGLTECWTARSDGAAYPLCPGVAGGTFDPAQHAFVNLSAADVTADLVTFAAQLRSVNPSAQIIVTVSPVPLIATVSGEHVLVATTYSKSVLRVAAAQAEAGAPEITYFPSYEIITGNFNRGAYFAADCRSVTEEGVDHVMRVFMRHFTDDDTAEAPRPAPVAAEADAHTAALQNLVRVVCDEEALDRGA